MSDFKHPDGTPLTPAEIAAHLLAKDHKKRRTEVLEYLQDGNVQQMRGCEVRWQERLDRYMAMLQVGAL